jgi:histidyl-tRNA synthetase
VPIDTPALEYAEILLGKGGGETEKQVYRFTDAGGRDIALRFDLTVPLARFTAAHLDQLPMPFKRYHIAKVWRGENTQRGRYREFMQCDCDVIGEDSAQSDFEIVCMIRAALSAAGAGDVSIHINHRGLFNRFLDRIGERDKSVAILRTVDKLAKIGPDETLSLLAADCGDKKAAEIVDFVKPEGGWDETLKKLTLAAGGDCPESERLALMRRFMRDAGISGSFKLDPSITRGLDYYTGIVYETFLLDMPEIGSVCSGGRYGDLAGLYTKAKLSGAGASIGLDRLIAAMSTLGRLSARSTYADLAIAALEEGQAGLYQKAAMELREAGIACEVMRADAGKLTAFFITAENAACGMRYFAQTTRQRRTLNNGALPCASFPSAKTPNRFLCKM